MNYQKEKLRKQFHLKLQKNPQKPKNKFNQGCTRPVLRKV